VVLDIDNHLKRGLAVEVLSRDWVWTWDTAMERTFPEMYLVELEI